VTASLAAPEGGRKYSDVGGRTEASLPWLARLRWGAIAGQIAAILGGHYLFGGRLPLPALLACVVLTAATNVWLSVAIRRRSQVPPVLVGGLLVLDTVSLTAILHLTGGPTNPFSIIYLVHITLAAVMLGAAWTWALAALAVACYVLLFVLVSPDVASHHMMGGDFSSHLHGMLLAFAVAAGLTAYFVVQLLAAIEHRDADLAEIRAHTARNERLASLATLAAGAAHELGTPLATIAVAANELERRLAAFPGAAAGALLDDARLIRAELGRCRQVLDDMAARSGEASGEAPGRFPPSVLVEDVLGGLGTEDRDRVAVTVSATGQLAVPRRALSRAVGNLVQNALDAAPRGRIRLAVEQQSSGIRIAVHDDGPGIPPDVMAHVGEPFFSTKAAGRGMGLGIFLSKAIAEQMGGRLALESAPGHGATAIVELPSSALSAPLATSPA